MMRCAMLLPAAIAAAAAAAGQPSAHDPQYDNKAAWPGLTGKEYFLKEAWPKGRLYVWAHPGQGGGSRAGRGALDVTDPRNWLLDGKPAAELLLDENADLLFPASEQPYSVGFRGTEIREVCRHITIEPGAGFVGGGDGRGRQIHGNVWIRKGGNSDCQGATSFLGSRHTFFRNDNVEAEGDAARGKNAGAPGNRGGGIMVAQYFTFNKDEGKSVEFLGHVSVLDEFRIFACTVIVGPGSRLRPGRNASPTIDRGGVLALMDGAYFGSWTNNFGTPDLAVKSGTIQGGLPDRPLKTSCTFGLSFKNHTAATFDYAGRSGGKDCRRVPSLWVQSGALRSYSADPAEAHLRFAVMPDGIGDRIAQNIRPMPGSPEEEADLRRNPDAAARYKWFDALPRGVDVHLGGGVAVDGVEFDGFRKGGVMYADPAAKATWKNVFFGPACKAPAAEMTSHVPEISRMGEY